jgi:preprotein translocase subunit SecY
MSVDVSAPPLHAPLSRRLLITVGLILAYRVGCQIPVPGIDFGTITRLRLNLALEHISIFALGVTPFFSVLLLFEFTKLIAPPLSRWEASDPAHARRLHGWILILSLAFAAFQARGLANALSEIDGLVNPPDWVIPIALTMVAGTALLAWFADQITRNGIVAGFWLLLITPMVVQLPAAVALSFEAGRTGIVSTGALAAAATFIAIAVALAATADSIWHGQATLRDPGSDARQIRVSGADFMIVWPPLLAGYATGLVLVLFTLVSGDTGTPLGEAVRLAVFVLFVVLFTLLQSLGDRCIRPIWPVALIQIVVCVGAEVLSRRSMLPAPISGLWLIVLVTVACNAIRGLRSARQEITRAG